MKRSGKYFQTKLNLEQPKAIVILKYNEEKDDNRINVKIVTIVNTKLINLCKFARMLYIEGLIYSILETIVDIIDVIMIGAKQGAFNKAQTCFLEGKALIGGAI